MLRFPFLRRGGRGGWFSLPFRTGLLLHYLKATLKTFDHCLQVLHLLGQIFRHTFCLDRFFICDGIYRVESERDGEELFAGPNFVEQMKELTIRCRMVLHLRRGGSSPTKQTTLVLLVLLVLDQVSYSLHQPAPDTVEVNGGSDVIIDEAEVPLTFGYLSVLR
jgi:hypothetical protein